jgi:hypothetical protein
MFCVEDSVRPSTQHNAQQPVVSISTVITARPDTAMTVLSVQEGKEGKEGKEGVAQSRSNGLPDQRCGVSMDCLPMTQDETFSMLQSAERASAGRQDSKSLS